MDSALLTLVAVVILALVFDFINGFHDSANAIATVVSTKVLSPRTAVLYGAILNFLGALTGTEVAATIGKGLVDQQVVTMDTLLASIVAAIIWNLITWVKGLPTSSSHALIGSLLGATVCGHWLAQGAPLNASALYSSSIHWAQVWQKVVVPMLVSPVLGITMGFALMAGLTWLVYKQNLRKINGVFGKLQLVSAGWMAYEHGRNDAQKSMGIIALALMTYSASHGANNGQASAFSVPLWVMLSCAIAMGLGTLNGGWKIIRTLGSKMIKIQPIHGFAAETTAALLITVASKYGIPLSTTQVISTSIMGVGATKRLSAVKWGVVSNIIWAWVLTLPLTFSLAAGLMAVLVGVKHLIAGP
jgi:inorganic phosphate transporter, PiT family